jgi:hypothetical protein
MPTSRGRDIAPTASRSGGMEVAAWKMLTVRRGMRALRGAGDAAIADSLQRRHKWCANIQISPPIRHSL